MRLLWAAILGICFLVPVANGQNFERVGAFVVDSDNPTVALFSGPIDQGAAADFRQVLLRFPDVNLLLLNSGGGSVVEALAIADLVFNFSIATIIPEEASCYSACAFVFLAGVNRAVFGELGVHQIDAADPNLFLAQVAIAEIFDRLDRYGVDPEVVRLMLTTPPDAIHVFTTAEIEEFGLNRIDTAIGFGGPLMPTVPPQGADDTVSIDRVALFQGLDFYGADLDVLTVGDVAACAAACMNNNFCWAFTFNVETRSGPNCFIKSSTGIPDANVQALSGMLIARGSPSPAGFSVGVIDPTMDLLRGFDLPLGDMSASAHPNAETRAECRLACTQNSVCRGFSFVESNGQCWLKSSISTPVPQDGITSGIKQGTRHYTPIDIIWLD